jgi:hypothetical protein
MTAKERYQIAMNVVAKMGIDNPMFINEYSKTISNLQGFQSQMEMQPPPMAPPMGQPPIGQAPQEPLGAGGLGMEQQPPIEG